MQNTLLIRYLITFNIYLYVFWTTISELPLVIQVGDVSRNSSPLHLHQLNILILRIIYPWKKYYNNIYDVDTKLFLKTI